MADTKSVVVKLVFHSRPFKFKGLNVIEMLGQDIAALNSTIPFLDRTAELLSVTVDREAFELKHEMPPPDEIHVFNIGGRSGESCGPHEFHFKNGTLQQMTVGLDPDIKQFILKRPNTAIQAADD